MRKVAGVLGLVSLVAAATLVLAVPGDAQSVYPPPVCSLSLPGGQNPEAGGQLHVLGSGFAPGEEVTLTMNGQVVGSTTASGAGTIDTTVTIPANATSPVKLSAGDCSITFTLQPIPPPPTTLVPPPTTLVPPPPTTLGPAVVPAKPVQAKALAFTGSDSSPLVIAGIVAVALGTVLIFGARRRSASKAAVEAAKVRN